MREPNLKEYPFQNSDINVVLDDAVFAQQELKEESRNWRSELYREVSNVLCVDIHGDGQPSSSGMQDGAFLRKLHKLDDPAHPKMRFIVLQSTPCEYILKETPHTPGSPLHDNEMGPDPKEPKPLEITIGGNHPEPETGDKKRSWLNIDRETLLSILTHYEIPPSTASHIRGQEQVFGSKVSFDEPGQPRRFDLWYAIRARATMKLKNLDKYREADLKVTVITHFDITARKSVTILKLRFFNDLPEDLNNQLVDRLKKLCKDKGIETLASDPFASGLFMLHPLVQWYRRGAREPRDKVREMEDKVHQQPTTDKQGEPKQDFRDVDLRDIHQTLASLEQDLIQLEFCTNLLQLLRDSHKKFRDLANVPKMSDAVFNRVDEKLEEFQMHFAYMRDSMRDVRKRTERMLNLMFNLASRSNSQLMAKMAEHTAFESAAMKAIAVVTMTALPLTAISTFFGSNFISQPTRPVDDPNPSAIYWSNQTWWLGAITAPLTIFVFTCYYVFQYHARQSIRQKLTKITEV